MKLLGYIRVSTEEQAEGGRSLSVQDMALQRYCELHGHDLVDVLVEEGVSAGMDLERRPVGALLLDRLRDGDAEGVVVQRLDRLFRLTMDGLQTFAWLDRRGLVAHSVNEHIDTTTPEGKLQLTMMLALAEFEKNRTSQRARETSEGLRAQARAWGPTPYGCVRAGEYLRRDPNTWPIREQIVRLREQQSLSLRAIAAELEAQGIANPAGGRFWHVSTVRGIVNSHGDMEHIPPLESGNDAPVSPLRAVQ